MFAAQSWLARQRGLKRRDPDGGLYGRDRRCVQAGRVRALCATLGTALTAGTGAPAQALCARGVGVLRRRRARGSRRFCARWISLRNEGVCRPACIDFPGGMDPDEYVRDVRARTSVRGSSSRWMPTRLSHEAARRRDHDLIHAGRADGSTQSPAANVSGARSKSRSSLKTIVDQLMRATTGFAREVLLAQIGRTELIAGRQTADVPPCRAAARREKRRRGHRNRRGRKGAARPAGGGRH